MNLDPKIHCTKNFKWDELIVSEEFPDLEKEIELYDRDKRNYHHLISTTLQPERDQGASITKITQGKRSFQLYQALISKGYKPSPHSQHFCAGNYDCAIDFQKIIKVDNEVSVKLSRIVTKAAYQWILTNCYYGFGQMYYTAPQNKNQIGFIHIGSVTDKHQSEHWVIN